MIAKPISIKDADFEWKRSGQQRNQKQLKGKGRGTPEANPVPLLHVRLLSLIAGNYCTVWMIVGPAV